MLTANEKRSLLNIMVAGSCSAIITLATLTSPASANEANDFPEATTSNCLFSTQLASDPSLKSAFTTKVSASKLGMTEEGDDDLIYTSDIKAGSTDKTFADSGSSIDRLSNDCLSCHDGVMAQNFKIRVKNNPNGRVMSLEDIIGGHPVGMEYDRYVSVNGKNYKRDVKFSTEMVFAEGKVGCLTCHNPLNTKKGHLVMNNDKSELCFSCHSK